MGRRIEPISGGTGAGAAGAGGAATAPRVADPESRSRITLEERFEDFKEVDGLTLPHTYRLTVNQSLAQSSFVGHWEMKFNSITHDRAIDAKIFKVK